MNAFKIGDMVTFKTASLMLDELPPAGTIIADGGNLQYYTPEECTRLGYEYPRTGWWCILWNRGINAGRVSDTCESVIKLIKCK